MEKMEKIFSALSFVLAMIAFMRYTYTIGKSAKKDGSLRPSNIVILLLGVMDVLLFITYVSENTWDTMAYMLLSYVIGGTLLFLSLLRYGKWSMNKEEKRESTIVILGALFGMFLWYHYKSAILGHYLLVLINIIIFVPLIKKVIREPWTEDLVSWLLWFSANLFSLLPLLVSGKWTIENGLLTSVYFILYTLVIIPMISFLRNKSFLGKSIITTMNEIHCSSKKGKNLKRLTKIARHLNLIKKDEYLAKFYIKKIVTLYTDHGYIEEKYFLKKEKTPFFVKKLRADLSAYLCLLEDKGISIDNPLIKNIMEFLNQGQYFTAKSHFEYDGSELLSNEMYLFIKEIFKN